MGFWDSILGRNKELDLMFDLDLLDQQSSKTSLKRQSIQTVIGMIARTIIQSDFRIKQNGKYVVNDMYYRFNVKPNKNQSAAVFWEQVINKLIYDGECLVIKSDTDDLLVADDYTRKEYALFGDKFDNVVIKDYEYKRPFNREDVIFFEYGNDKLSSLIDSLFSDYGELLGRVVDYQMRKNQIRSTVDIEAVQGKGEETQKRLQAFIDRAYKAIRENAVAIMPQQKGFKYEEHQKSQSSGQSVDEINKLTDGYMNQIANAVGLPIGLLRGDLADVEKITRNYMIFCINPILTLIGDELNMQFVEKDKYIKGDRIDIRRVRHRDIFDVATAVDKLIASGGFNGNEIRDELGYEMTDEEIHEKYFITKNYQESNEALKGGENE